MVYFALITANVARRSARGEGDELERTRAISFDQAFEMTREVFTSLLAIYINNRRFASPITKSSDINVLYGRTLRSTPPKFHWKL